MPLKTLNMRLHVLYAKLPRVIQECMVAMHALQIKYQLSTCTWPCAFEQFQIPDRHLHSHVPKDGSGTSICKHARQGEHHLDYYLMRCQQQLLASSVQPCIFYHFRHFSCILAILENRAQGDRTTVLASFSGLHMRSLVELLCRKPKVNWYVPYVLLDSGDVLSWARRLLTRGLPRLDM